MGALIHFLWVNTAEVLVLTLGVLAFWRGGWAERLTVVLILVAWNVTPLLQKGYDPGLATTLLDGAVMAVVFIISVFSRRMWTLAMNACLLTNLVSHITAEVVPHLGFFAYVTTMGLIGGYGVALCLGLAFLEVGFIQRMRLDQTVSS